MEWFKLSILLEVKRRCYFCGSNVSLFLLKKKQKRLIVCRCCLEEIIKCEREIKEYEKPSVLWNGDVT